MISKKNNLYKASTLRILWAGIVMSILLVCAIEYYRVIDFQKAQTLFLAFVAHALGGRAAGVGLCLMNGLCQVWTIMYNFYIEILIVFLVYSVFVLSINNYVKLRIVRFMALKLERKARRHKDNIKRYGWIGLFFFVMVPLPVTGPVMGAIVGYLLKFRSWGNFSAVLLGTLTAITTWTVFFDFLDRHLHIIQYVFIGIIIVAGLSYIKTIRDWIINRV